MLLALLHVSPLAPLLLAAAMHSDPVSAGASLRTLGTDMGFLEGPVWVPGETRLVFSDIPNAKLMQWTEARGIELLAPADHPNGNTLDADGHLITCEHGTRSLVRRNASTGAPIGVIVDRYQGRRLHSPNDVALHRSGVLWFTDPPWGLPKQREGRELPGNYVFRFEPRTQRLTAAFTKWAMPNGIALSPGEGLLFISDTGGHRSHPDEALRTSAPAVRAFALDAQHEVISPEPLWTLPERSDGMCVDALGRLYLTSSPGVTIWGNDGVRISEITVPGSTTNVCLGGPDANTLFITAGKALYSIQLEALAQ